MPSPPPRILLWHTVDDTLSHAIRPIKKPFLIESFAVEPFQKRLPLHAASFASEGRLVTHPIGVWRHDQRRVARTLRLWMDGWESAQVLRRDKDLLLQNSKTCLLTQDAS